MKRKLRNEEYKKSLPRFSETYDWYGVSVRAAALLGTSVLKVNEIVTEDKRKTLVDPSKVFREKQPTGMIQAFHIPLTETT